MILRYFISTIEFTCYIAKCLGIQVTWRTDRKWQSDMEGFKIGDRKQAQIPHSL